MIDLDLDVSNHTEKMNDVVFSLRSEKEGNTVILASKNLIEVSNTIHECMHENIALKSIMLDSVLNYLQCVGGDELKQFKKIIKKIEKNE